MSVCNAGTVPREPLTTSPAVVREGTIRRLGPLVAWVGMLGVVVVGGVALGATPALSAPPLAGPAEMDTWARTREPIEAAFAVVRIVVVAVGCYLLAATVASLVSQWRRAVRVGRTGGVGRAVPVGRAVRALDVVTVPFVTRMVHGALGLGLVGATVAPATSASATAAAAPGTTRASTTPVSLVVATSWWEAAHQPPDQRPEPGPEPDTVLSGSAYIESPPPTMRRLDPPSAVAPSVAPSAVAAAVVEPVSAADEVVLEAGDHLWSVSAQALADAWGREPSDDQVAPYWEVVVAENRDRLADPANPDLVFPGQVVALPTPPPAP